MADVYKRQNCSNTSRSYCTSTLTDSECKTLLHSYWMDELDCHLYVITRHAHLCTSRQVANTSNVSCTEVELRSVVVEERCMTATLVLCQNVNLSGKLVVALNGTWLAQTPVSYTHLECVNSCMSGALSKNRETGIVEYDEKQCAGCFMCVMTVSYTHLDVYKRQVNVLILLCAAAMFITLLLYIPVFRSM